MTSFQPDTGNVPYQDNINVADDGTTLFLGDLSVYSTENHIRELFQSYGKIENIRIKRGNSTKPHLCYGFIKFDSRAAAEKALSSLNGVMFLGRTLRVGWAEKKSQNPQQQLQSRGGVIGMKGVTKGMETAQIHVSFISKQIDALISESTLRSLFSMYGEVIDVAIKKSQFDKKLKLQNGYGFVHYRLDEQGIQSAIQATSAIHQVTIDRVTYDCSLSHSLEVMIQQQGIQAPPLHLHHHHHHGDSSAIDDQQHLDHQGLGEDEDDVTHLHAESALADVPELPLSTVNLSTLQSALANNNDQGVTAAFPMLQAPVGIDFDHNGNNSNNGGGNNNTNPHYQIQNAQPDYNIIAQHDMNTTLEFFPNFHPQPPVNTTTTTDNYTAAGFPQPFYPHSQPHLHHLPLVPPPPPPPGTLTGNPFQHSLNYTGPPGGPNATYLNPNFQLGIFYPPTTADFSSHLFPTNMSPSPMNASFYDDGTNKMTGPNAAAAAAAVPGGAGVGFPKHFEGLGGLGGIGLGGFDTNPGATHTPTGLADYPSQSNIPFPSLHNPFQATAFEPIMFPSLSTGGAQGGGVGVNGGNNGDDINNHPTPSQAAPANTNNANTTMHFNQHF